MQDGTRSKTTVLFIGGEGRSGSTLLDRMLGQLPGFVSTGELREVWNRGLVENLDCGCGVPFRSCPFWTAVGDEAFGGWANVDPVAIRELGARIDRQRLVPLMLMRRVAPDYQRHVDRYVDVMGRLYRAIRVVSKADVIIDSSKSPSVAFIVRRAPDLDLRVVHLLRDVRGVAYSWTKRVRRPDAGDREMYMHQYHPARMAARWLHRGALMDVLGTMHPHVVVHYEDVVTEPRRTLQRIVSELGLRADGSAFDFVSDHTVNLGANHTVMGNPVRMQVGPMPLRLDDEWRTAMPAGQRRLVTAVALPMLIRYGYRV